MQSIGERLEEARKRKGVTIREAAEATKIRGDYLNSFEGNNFSINVPDIYVRGFLRSYCNFLKVNSEKVITDYNANLIGEAKAAKREHREFFGRMELQQTPLVGEEPKKAGAVDDDKLSAEEEENQGGPSFLQNLEKDVVIKVGIIGVVAVLLILAIVWIFRALTTGGVDDIAANNSRQMVPTSNEPAAVETANSEQLTKTITLIAVGDVRITVTGRNSGRILIDSHPMAAGQRLPIEITESVRIDYSEGANLRVSAKGQTFGTGRTGPDFNDINFEKI